MDTREDIKRYQGTLSYASCKVDCYFLMGGGGGGGGGGGEPFLGLAGKFFKSNAFQTIFFNTFCNENNFL